MVEESDESLFVKVLAYFVYPIKMFYIEVVREQKRFICHSSNKNIDRFSLYFYMFILIK